MKMRDGEPTKNKMCARASVSKQPFGKASDKSLIHDINFSFGVGSDSQPQPIQHKTKSRNYRKIYQFKSRLDVSDRLNDPKNYYYS